MKTNPILLVAISLILLNVRASATVLYVDLNCTNSTPPFADWTTAATNIQDAVDAAVDGDQILVTNGIYQTGGRVVYGALTNRVVINKAVTVESVNGPAVTIIQGNTVIGDSAVRCVYLTNSAVLVGFTLTGGATRSDGDWFQEQSGGSVWCESTNATLSNCVLHANSAAAVGGGVYQGTLNGCILSSNATTLWWYSGGGGGANSSTLNNCLLYGNESSLSGGGAANCTLKNCTIVNNSAGDGGGAYNCMLNNCIVFYNGDNYAASTLNNCCTTPDPSFEESNEGTSGDGDVGTNCIIAEPLFVDLTNGDFHLQSNSPCINMGNNAFVASSTDLDGNPRIIGGTVDIGAYEFPVPVPLNVGIQAAYTNVAKGFAASFEGVFGQGRPSVSFWNFGDGTVVSNQLPVSHSWAAGGDYLVVLWAYNESTPNGMSATTSVHVVEQFVHYVALDSANPVAPYTSWDTAATNIQDAVDAASIPGALVLVTNGVYRTGVCDVAGVTNRVTVMTSYLTVASVNGPDVTVIEGYQVPGVTNGNGAIRCVYLTNNVVLSGFTLTTGAVSGDGGGIWCESDSAIVTNCVLVGNSASGSGGGAFGGAIFNCVFTGNAADNGGAADTCSLNNCVLTANTAGSAGGGANNCTANNTLIAGNWAAGGGGAEGGILNNCTLTGNSADHGGGSEGGTLNNCIVFYNLADSYGANYWSSALNYCCATPLPADGTNNITLDPQFSDSSHLSPGSPCIGAGSTNYATGEDLDGAPWLNPPSIGCNEYHPGATGGLTVAIRADHTNAVTDFSLNFVAVIVGHAGSNYWNFGDGTAEANQLQVSHRWTAPGDYPVVLQAFNDDNPGGISATVTVHVVTELIWHVDAGGTNPVPPYLSWDTAATNIQDAVNVATLMPKSFILATNGWYAPLSVGKPVGVRSVNGPAVTFIDGGGVQRCVYLANGAMLAGFTLTNGWDYVGAGAYCESASAVLSNCVLVGNSVIDSGGGAYQGTLNSCLLSQNSATYYIYYPPWWNGKGGGALNCTLNNCALINNHAYAGGGAYNCTLNNCTLNSNSARGTPYSGTGIGGGMCYGAANNCTLSGNTAALYGGGESYAVLNNCVTRACWAYIGGGDYCGTLSNCTLAGNGAALGGGTCNGAFYNCILYYNSSSFSQGNYTGGSYDHCCVTPDPGGSGNITSEPLFVDQVGGDFHLQTNSPCINSGNNTYVSVTNDLDGNPRIVGGTVDIGAYEYQTPTSVISYAWLQQYGLTNNGSADYADTDGDGMNNWQEWRTGTSPADALSLLKMTTVTNGVSGITVTWQSASGITYFLQRGSNLTAAFSCIQSNIVGQAGTTSFTDTNAVGSGPFFYRVGVW